MLGEARSWSAMGRAYRSKKSVELQAWRRLVADYLEAVEDRRAAWAAVRAAEQQMDAVAPRPESLAHTLVLHGRRMDVWFESEDAIDAAIRADNLTQADGERLRAVLRRWREDQDAARERLGLDALRGKAEACLAQAEAQRERLLAAPAPDLESVAYKLTLLPLVIDDLWDFSDPEVLAELRAGKLPDRETAPVATIYFDILRLAAT